MKVIKMLLSNKEQLEELKNIFNIAVQDVAPLSSSTMVDECWADLKDLYDKINLNAYHNVNHMMDCILKLDSIEEILYGKINESLFEIAILYHDCIYVPGRTDNEIKSSIIATKMMKCFGFEKSEIKYVTNLIIGNVDDMAYEYNIFRDIDYSILGEHSFTYNEYRKSIEAEFLSIYTYQDYIAGRLKFLVDIMNGIKIFKTSILGNVFEYRAKINIAEEIEFLKREQRRAKPQ